MIACLRAVHTPAEVRDGYLDWIGEGRASRQALGIMGGLVCEPTCGDGDTVVIPMWPDDARSTLGSLPRTRRAHRV